VFISSCIKSRADALANLPVPGQGGFRKNAEIWPLRQPNGDAPRQPSSVRNRWRVFHMSFVDPPGRDIKTSPRELRRNGLRKTGHAIVIDCPDLEREEW
jgi:hypothetical protein